MKLYTRTMTQELCGMDYDSDEPKYVTPKVVIQNNKNEDSESINKRTPIVNININVSVTDNLDSTKYILREMIQFAKSELNN